METNTMSRAKLLGILLCFFLSGAAGLIYQVAWGKALGLIFGHTVYAIATVLAVFMAGLALGSAWLGRWSESRARPVALYGWVELGVAATGALSLAGLAGVRSLYLAAFHHVAGSAAALLALRFAGTAVVLFLPTFLMGGTLPILVRGLSRRFNVWDACSGDLATRVSRLYWVNTAGAVAGTLAAGFWLLPAVGLRLTVASAIALNLTAGALALLLSLSFSESAPDSAEPRQQAAPEGVAALSAANAPGNLPLAAGVSVEPQRPYFLLASFAAVGATAMAYEIGWTRLLATILGSSTYAFTLMLATFLVGIVLGSMLFEKWIALGHEVHPGTFALTQTVTAMAALVFLVFFQQLPRVVPPLLRATHETFGGLVLAQFVTSALAMLPAAVVFGFNFPAVTVLIAGRSGASGGHAAAVGRAYAANTLGAILGAVAAGFWLVPRLGSFRVVALAATLNLLLALVLASRASAPERHSGTFAMRRWLALSANLTLLAVTGVVGWSGAFYNRALATFGTVLYWDLYEGRLTPAENAATTDILYAADGLNASISVARTEDYLALRTNGKVDASNGDTITQLMLGHLGAVFHPAPRRVLVIGFGSGMTLSALARYPEIERLDCVEIEPEVIRAANYLEPLNRGVLRDPRLHVILDDARNFLLTTREQYDLIVSEPSNPWIAGVATLFTEEYYRAARARLRPGGFFVQWVQSYSLYPDDLRMILRTFVPQFPHVTLWHGNGPDLLLLGRSESGPFSFDRLRRLWLNEALRGDYQTLHIRRPEGLLAFYLLDDAELRRVVSEAEDSDPGAAGSGAVPHGSSGPRNTDDHTLLEYRAPRALLARNLEDRNMALLHQHRHALLPSALSVSDADRAGTLEAAAETLLAFDEKDEAARYLAPLANAPPTAALELLRGRLELARSQFQKAREAFDSALRLAVSGAGPHGVSNAEPQDTASFDAALGLAEVARRRDDSDTATLLLRQILERDPKFIPALDALVTMARDAEDWAQASDWQAKRIAADPAATPREYCRLGEFLLRLGDFPRAERSLLIALGREPYSYAGHRNLAELYVRQKLWPQARAHLEFVVRYFPDNDPQTYSHLADIYRTLGEPAAATQILRKGRRIFPDDSDLRRKAPFF